MRRHDFTLQTAAVRRAPTHPAHEPGRILPHGQETVGVGSLNDSARSEGRRDDGSGGSNALLQFSRRIMHVASAWRERARQRRDLARLNDRLLSDIGLSRADVEGEVTEHFWRG